MLPSSLCSRLDVESKMKGFCWLGDWCGGGWVYSSPASAAASPPPAPPFCFFPAASSALSFALFSLAPHLLLSVNAFLNTCVTSANRSSLVIFLARILLSGTTIGSPCFSVDCWAERSSSGLESPFLTRERKDFVGKWEVSIDKVSVGSHSK